LSDNEIETKQLKIYFLGKLWYKCAYKQINL
jgi:hypothetical protein